MSMNGSGSGIARVILAAALGLSVLTVSHAEVRYQVIDLGVGMFQTLPDAVPVISNTGLVAGTDTFPSSRAYLWDNGQVLRIEPNYTGALTLGFGVNDHGAVVGTTPGPGINGPINRPFVYQQGTLTYIPDVVANSTNVNARAAYAINNAGAVVGEWEARPFIYADGVSRFLETSTNAAGESSNWGFAKDISNHGWAVGTMSYQSSTGAVIWHDGIAVDIGSLPVLSSQRPDVIGNAINDLGEVVGASNSANGRNAFFWSHGEMIDLGSLRGPGWGSEALDVSNHGVVVGKSACVGVACAFIWTREEGMLQLQNHIDPASDWILNTATSINDAGWIVGNGFRRSTGLAADFLLIPSPVPEPSAWGMLLSGILAASVALRQRKSRH